jgi:hypothetical protein
MSIPFPWSLETLENQFHALGFAVTIQELDDIFFFLQVWRQAS